jgi:predicted GNAT family N-acyltransferase
MTAPVVLPVPLNSDLGRLGLALRREVFVGEQHVPEDIEYDAYDAIATHLVAILDGDVVGVLRIVFLPEHAKFGRVAVRATARGKGIASAMMRVAMDLAKSKGEVRCYLTSQLDKIPLYEKLGFAAYGDIFTEGGMPHKAMKNY